MQILYPNMVLQKRLSFPLQAEQVMPEVGEKLGARAMRVLLRRGVDIRLGHTLKEVHADHVVLSDGSRVNTRTVAWVAG